MSKTSQMKCVVSKEQQLCWIEQPKPTPTARQILIKVHAAGVNRADLLQVRGHYAPPSGESDILGLECAGVVVECGASVGEFSVGDRVMALLGSGGYAEYVAVDAALAVKIPLSVDFITAAATPEAYCVAHACLVECAHLKNSDRILIHAAGSGVGIAMLQMAKQLGASLIMASVGSEWKRERCLQQGADAVVFSRSEDLITQIREVTDEVDVVIDFVGARYFSEHLDLLAERGRLIAVATMGGVKATVNLLPILQKRLQLTGFVLRRQSLNEKSQLFQRFLARWPELWQLPLTPVIDSVFDWTDVESAHEYIRENKNFGKVVLEL